MLRLRNFAAIAAIGVAGAAGSAQAATIFQLLNHPDGGRGGDYGLRLDNEEGLQTFNFDAGVYLNIDPVSDSARIFGTVMHNQSGDFYLIQADIDLLQYTHDGSEWRSNTSGDLYDGVIEDLIADGDSASAIDEMDLKDLSTLADRIGFNSVDLALTYMADGGTDGVTYSVGSQTGPTFNFVEYPPGFEEETIPFMIVKGFRFPADSDNLTGVGWLTDVPGQRTGFQDFIFQVGPPIPEPTSFGLMGAASLLLLRRRA